MLGRLFGGGRSVNAKQSNGVFISGDGNNVSISYGPTEARLTIPFKPNSLTSNIASLLSWQSQLTQLIGRNETVEELLQWANSGPCISLKLIYGEGGVGKTRLAFELANRLHGQDWEAGQLSQLEGGAFRLGEKGTLLVIDYPEQQPKRVQQLLQAIKDAKEPPTPLRILLLSRHPQLLDQLGEPAHLLAAEQALLHLTALDKEDTAWSLLEAAWPRLCRERSKEGTPLPVNQDLFDRWLEQHQSHAQPLFILAYAINLIDEPDAIALSGGEILKRLAQREIDRLEKEGRAKDLNPLALPLLKGLAAISGGINTQQLNTLAHHSALATLLPSYDQLRSCTLWQEGENGANRVAELQPDLLAAALLSQLLERDDDQPGEWLYAALDISDEINNASSRLGRLMHDAVQVLGLPWPTEALIEAVKQDLPRCRRLDEGLCRDYLELPLQPLALHVGQVLAEAEEEPAEQARLLNNLSVDLAESGRREEGLKANQQAVEIQEKLAADNFAAYGPDLAISLNNLSNRLAENGKREEGLEAIQRAVESYEELAADNFTAYGPDLAMSLNNLSIRLAESGKREEGLEAIQRAVEIREKLAADNFAAYGPALASSLNNLSVDLAENGEREEGLEAIQQAVEIQEKLAADNFAAYGPDLAISLNNLSNRLAENGKQEEGLQAIQRPWRFGKSWQQAILPPTAPNSQAAWPFWLAFLRLIITTVMPSPPYSVPLS